MVAMKNQVGKRVVAAFSVHVATSGPTSTMKPTPSPGSRLHRLRDRGRSGS
jgi:hypothetical protein